MKKRFITLIVFICILFFDSVFAELYTYPDRITPIFYIDFPNDWDTVAEEEMIYSRPFDEKVFIILWSVETKSIDSAAKEVDTILKDIFADVGIIESKELSSNNIPFRKFSGKAKLDEENINFSLSVFTPDNQVNFMLLYFGDPEDKFKYTKDFNHVFYSIKRAPEIN